MFRVMKKIGEKIIAYRLGDKDKCETLEKLISEKRIRAVSKNTFEVFSQEAVNGKGEIAHIGDYIKIDTAGFPYPNEKTFFEKNHIKVGNNEYIQIPEPLYAWSAEEPISKEIEFLIEKKGLIIAEDNTDRYFTAPLWGTLLSAPRDSIIVFYLIEKDREDNIMDIDYNFVQREEFEKNYFVL